MLVNQPSDKVCKADTEADQWSLIIVNQLVERGSNSHRHRFLYGGNHGECLSQGKHFVPFHLKIERLL